MKKMVATLLAVVFMLTPLLHNSVRATDVLSAGETADVTITSNATMAGSFEDDCIIVIMTNEASVNQLY